MNATKEELQKLSHAFPSMRYDGLISREAAAKYAESLRMHLECVRHAGLALGLDEMHLENHDLSKWGPEEFVPYANWFWHRDIVGQEAAEQSEYRRPFLEAWNCRMHRNKHHWQYWLLVKDAGQIDALEMPEIYATEMIADWLGASMAYTGSWDMTEWLQENYSKLVLHPNTRKFVTKMLIDLDYDPLLLIGEN